MLFERRGPGHDYERLCVVQRAVLGLRAIVAIHSTRRGPAFGGIRRRAYTDEAEALSEVLELAEAMSHKCALAGLDAGGGKTVILVPPGPVPDWDRAYEALGREIAGLGGQYVCGPDVGTGVAELEAVRRVCTHINPAGNDAGASTAAGVLAGLRAVFAALELGDAPRSVAIQGLGSVGLSLATALRAEGVVVTGADLRAEACREAAERGVEVVAPEVVSMTPCDVFVPCAMGHGLDASTIEGLRCRAICGSANNQLATPEDAERLVARGILHAPDVVVSAGAVIEGVLTLQHGQTAAVREQVARTIAAIEGTVGEILSTAASTGRPPSEVARAMARQRLESTPAA